MKGPFYLAAIALMFLMWVGICSLMSLAYNPLAPAFVEKVLISSVVAAIAIYFGVLLAIEGRRNRP